MQKIFILLIFLMTKSAYAYHPTFDSLLRNSTNVDIGLNTVLVELNIVQNNLKTETESEETQEIISHDKALKLLVFNENEKYPQLAQVIYKDLNVSKNSMAQLKNIPFYNFNKSLQEGTTVDQQFFYSIIRMLMGNDSSYFMSFFKKHGIPVLENKELRNDEKKRLLESYKDYLVKIKEDESADIENPLKPVSDEKKEEVQKIQAMSFLAKDPMVKRVKKGSQFFWNIDHEKVKAIFNDQHELLELKVMIDGQELSAIFAKYKDYRAGMRMPEFILLKDSTGVEYKISTRRATLFNDNKVQHYKRLGNYKDYIEENNFSDPLNKFSFLL